MAEPFDITPLKPTPRASGQEAPTRARRVWPIRPGKLIWLPVVAGLWMAVATYGTPHLRFQYNWSGHADRPVYHWCDYIGLHSHRIFPRGDACPVIKLLRPAGEG